MAQKTGALPADLEAAIVNAGVELRGKDNATTPAEQRVINPAVPLTDGPLMGPSGEGYMPASYKTTRGFVRTDR